ncbi:MAG: hypothetical protein SGJ20_18385 [Planctomycetota bacterium]|nr:hypothetical protein [Planctomycetota bacterium]
MLAVRVPVIMCTMALFAMSMLIAVFVLSTEQPVEVKVGRRVVLPLLGGRNPAVRMRNRSQMAGK